MVSPLLHHRLANLADLVTGIAVLGAGSSHSTHQLRIVAGSGDGLATGDHLPQSVQRTPAVRPVSVQVAGTSGTCAVLPVWAQAVTLKTAAQPLKNQEMK